MLLLVLDGADKSPGDITFGGCLDQGVAFLRAVTELLLHVLNPPLEAFQNLLGFLADVSQLPIREIGHVGHKDFAVIPECEEGWSWALPVALLSVLSWVEGTPRWDWTCRRSTARDALGLIKWH